MSSVFPNAYKMMLIDVIVGWSILYKVSIKYHTTQLTLIWTNKSTRAYLYKQMRGFYAPENFTICPNIGIWGRGVLKHLKYKPLLSGISFPRYLHKNSTN